MRSCFFSDLHACVRQNLVFKALFGSVSDDKYFLAVIFKGLLGDKYFFLMIIKISEFHLQFHEQSQLVVNVLLFTYKKC